MTKRAMGALKKRGFLRRVGNTRVVSVEVQQHGKRVHGIGVVIDDQYPSRRDAGSGALNADRFLLREPRQPNLEG